MKSPTLYVWIIIGSAIIVLFTLISSHKIERLERSRIECKESGSQNCTLILRMPMQAERDKVKTFSATRYTGLGGAPPRLEIIAMYGDSAPKTYGYVYWYDSPQYIETVTLQDTAGTTLKTIPVTN